MHDGIACVCLVCCGAVERTFVYYYGQRCVVMIGRTFVCNIYSAITHTHIHIVYTRTSKQAREFTSRCTHTHTNYHGNPAPCLLDHFIECNANHPWVIFLAAMPNRNEYSYIAQISVSSNSRISLVESGHLRQIECDISVLCRNRATSERDHNPKSFHPQ